MLAFVAPAKAGSITFTNSTPGGNFAASVTFDDTAVAGELRVTLTNTSTVDVFDPAHVLTAVFFNANDTLSTSGSSANLAGGSTVYYDSQPVGGDVGGEWAYASGLSGAPHGATQGISSSGFNLFGQPTFGTIDLEDPTAVDGVQYGIVSAGDLSATGNGGITGSGGLIHNSVTFILTGWTGNTSLISNVSFQYGTALNEPNLQTGTITTENITTETVVPEPTTLALLGTGLLGAARGLRRRKRASAAA